MLLGKLDKGSSLSSPRRRFEHQTAALLQGCMEAAELQNFARFPVVIVKLDRLQCDPWLSEQARVGEPSLNGLRYCLARLVIKSVMEGSIVT